MGSDAGQTGGFRYDDQFIKRMTFALCAILIVFPIVGIFLLATSDSPDPQPVGMTLLVTGLVFPLLTGAILGGQSLSPHGGWIGLLFFVGFAGLTVGPIPGALLYGAVGAWAFGLTGAALVVLSVLGFWRLGWKAKVPMWLQAPVIGSPRLYVRGSAKAENGGDPERDFTLPNALDGTADDDGPRHRQ